MESLARHHVFLEIEGEGFCEVPSVPKWSKIRPTTDGGVLTRAEQHRVHSFICAGLGLEDVSEVTLTHEEFVAFLSRSGSSLRRRYAGWDLRSSDVCWGWAAMLAVMGRLPLAFERHYPGGQRVSSWEVSSLLSGQWIAETAANLTAVRCERLMSLCAGCPGFTAGFGSWVVDTGGLVSLYERIKRGYLRGERELFYLDIGVLVAKGALEGDCLRLKRGGQVDLQWLEGCLEDKALHELVPRSAIHAQYALHQKWAFELTITALPSSAPPYWVCDLCSGFQSMKPAVEPIVTQMLGTVPVVYVGVDSAARLVAGERCFTPTVYGSLLDDAKFVPGRVVHCISTYLQLPIDRLIHVHLSSPCETNSPCNHSNTERGQGYRGTNGQALPVSAGTVPGPGETTQAKHQLCMDHDRLEQKCYSSLVSEAEEVGFSFTGENPYGVFRIKRHIARMVTRGEVREEALNYCAYGHYYEKLTTCLTNFSEAEWKPVGLTGDGRRIDEQSRAPCFQHLADQARRAAMPRSVLATAT